MSSVYSRCSQNMPRAGSRLQSFQNAMGLPETKTWVHCNPSKSLRMFIVDRDFRIWLQYYCQIPLFQTEYELRWKEVQRGSWCLQGSYTMVQMRFATDMETWSARWNFVFWSLQGCASSCPWASTSENKKCVFTQNTKLCIRSNCKL